MEYICVVDCEGCFFHTFDKISKLIVTEVSFVIMEKQCNKIVEYGFYRLTYDLRPIINLYNNKKTFNFANKFYHNTFQNKLYIKSNYEYFNPIYIKNLIINRLENKYNNYKIYSKGTNIESIFFDRNDIIDFNTYNNFPKFNDITNKDVLLFKILNSNNKLHPIGNKILKLLGFEYHFSIIECLIFLQYFIDNY
jgi:hypothetical protein